MNLHEYQGKELLKSFGVKIPEFKIAHTPEEALKAAKIIQEETNTIEWAVKAQIHAGGRGKGGGVKIAKNLNDVKQFAADILGMMLITPQTNKEGKLVKKILIGQSVYYEGESKIEEFYLSVLLDRATSRNIIMYSTEGGMDIESVASETPHLIFKEEIDPKIGLQDFQKKRIAFNLGLQGAAFKDMLVFVDAVYNAYIGIDASLIEINPLFKTSDNQLFAVDCKVDIDDNSLSKNPQIAAMRDTDEEDENEVEASKYNLNFVKLEGNVGCMVNGAGLAMATMDMIKLNGGNPANFLDVGGSANAKTVEAGLRIILKDKSVKVILINIFGGIVRCDKVAKGVVEAYKKIGNINIPIIVRLQGTNSEEGKKIIDDAGLKVYSATLLQDAAELVKTQCVAF